MESDPRVSYPRRFPTRTSSITLSTFWPRMIEPDLNPDRSRPAGPRRAGVLLPLFSIRTSLGWGLGEIPDIPRFAGWARRAGLSVLQLLPVGEVSGGETSPYAASTAFALDPVYLGLDDCEDFAAAGGRAGLSPADRAALDDLAAAPAIAWDRVRALKQGALRRAFSHFRRREWGTGSTRARALERFVEEHRDWMDDYRLFAAIHEHQQRAWWDWPLALRTRVPEVLEQTRTALAETILEKSWLQWLLDEQWHSARRDAAALGMALKGDLPFMVSGDSADVWSRQDQFRLDRRVGTPPDAFSETGQDWGLPAYDWENMERTGFAWMRARAARAGALYDLYRVDHVIGFYRTWSRSAADPEDAGFSPETEAEQLQLGEALIRIFRAHGEVVAEDLGMVPPFLRPSLTELGVPGYKVLRWEKAEDGTFYDPQTWPALSVATNGTHDIEPAAVWYDELDTEQRTALLQLPGLQHLDPDGPFDTQARDSLLRLLYLTPSMLAIIPFQDFFGHRERINVPGTVASTNWTYRTPMDLADLAADRATAERLAALARQAGRSDAPEPVVPGPSDS
jgi:4-alpha-glucanotransferase